MELVNYKGENYPLFQRNGNASQISIPFALHFCNGICYDIVFCKEE
jgi:hypothetical protein